MSKLACFFSSLIVIFCLFWAESSPCSRDLAKSKNTCFPPDGVRALLFNQCTEKNHTVFDLTFLDLFLLEYVPVNDQNIVCNFQILITLCEFSLMGPHTKTSLLPSLKDNGFVLNIGLWTWDINRSGTEQFSYSRHHKSAYTHLYSCGLEH